MERTKTISRTGYRRAALRTNPEVCSHCGFVPLDRCQLEVDHVDGDRENNTLGNLQVLCCNCHELKHHRPALFTCEELFQRVVGTEERQALFTLITAFRPEAFVGNGRPRTYTKNPENWAGQYSGARQAILDLLRDNGNPLRPKEIAAALDLKLPTVHSLLHRMWRDKALIRERGEYWPNYSTVNAFPIQEVAP